VLRRKEEWGERVEERGKEQSEVEVSETKFLELRR